MVFPKVFNCRISFLIPVSLDLGVYEEVPQVSVFGLGHGRCVGAINVAKMAIGNSPSLKLLRIK